MGCDAITFKKVDQARRFSLKLNEFKGAEDIKPFHIDYGKLVVFQLAENGSYGKEGCRFGI